MSNQDTYTQLPPGLDPQNLARLATQAKYPNQPSRDNPSGVPGGFSDIARYRPPTPDQSQDPQQTADAGDTTPVQPNPPDPLAPDNEQQQQKEQQALNEPPKVDTRTGLMVPEQLRRPYEPYVPVGPRRFGQDEPWGTPGWAVTAFAGMPDMMFGPYMPTPQESYGIVRGAGAQMAQWGAPSYGDYYGRAGNLATMMGPFLDAISGGKFSRAYTAARLGNLRIQREEMQMNLAIALEKHEEFLKGANEIFGQVMYHGMTGEQGVHAMEQYLAQTGHQKLLTVLQNGGLKALEGYLTFEDQKYRDSLAAHTSLKRATGPSDAERDAQWHGGGGAAGDPGAPAELPGPLGPDGRPATPAPPATSTPTATGTQSASDEELNKKYGFTNPKDMDAAHQILNGQDPFGKGGGPGDKLMTQIQAAAGDLRQRINTTAASGASQEEKLDTISDIDAAQGQKLRSLINYDADPKDPENKKMIGLAQQVSGGNYREGNYAIVQKYNDPNTDVGRSVRRVGTLSANAPRALEAINKLRENETMPERYFEKMWNGDFRGVDDRYVQIYNAVRPLVLESVALESGSGRPAVSTQHDMMKEFVTTHSPREMRSLIVNEARNAYGTAVQLNSQYRQLVGDPLSMAPGVFRYGMQDLNAIAHMNSTTGELPPGTPESIKYAGKTVPATLPALKTYSHEELDRFRKIYQGLPKNDPDRDFILKQVEDVF